MRISGIFCSLAIAAAIPSWGAGDLTSGLLAAGAYLTAAIAWAPWRPEHGRPISVVVALVVAALGVHVQLPSTIAAVDGISDNRPFDLGTLLFVALPGLALGAVATLLGLVSVLLWRPDPFEPL